MNNAHQGSYMEAFCVADYEFNDRFWKFKIFDQICERNDWKVYKCLKHSVPSRFLGRWLPIWSRFVQIQNNRFNMVDEKRMRKRLVLIENFVGWVIVNFENLALDS